MRTVQDGDSQPTEIGKKIEPKKPESGKPDNECWRPIPNHPGWYRHEVTGDVRRGFL